MALPDIAEDIAVLVLRSKGIWRKKVASEEEEEKKAQTQSSESTFRGREQNQVIDQRADERTTSILRVIPKMILIGVTLFAVFEAGTLSGVAQEPVRETENLAAAKPEASAPPPAKAEEESARLSTRIKDIANFEGVRDNQLIGYGLVVGLNRTGDRTQQNIFATQTIQNMLERMGITISPSALRPENTATVMITGTLPPFARPGSKIDVTVSSLADARSLGGGVLLMTPLKGIDGQVYAIAQGPVSIGGFLAGNEQSSVQVNHPTVGRVPGGALIERDAPFAINGQETLTLVLNDADFTTARRAEQAINKALPAPAAQAIDSRTIVISVPPAERGQIVRFMSAIENARLVTDIRAKVVINERTGTIIVGKNVKVSSAAISQGNLTVRITTEFEVSQPAPFARKGDTVVVPKTDLAVEEGKARPLVLAEGATVDEIVRGLHSVGATPRDIINILQALKSAGALQAELEIQ